MVVLIMMPSVFPLLN